MNRERGSVTIWGIGLVAVLFGFAGLAVDTWRVFTERQALAGLADSAAVAGANGIDEDAFRADGSVVLDPDEARRSPPDTWRAATATRSPRSASVPEASRSPCPTRSTSRCCRSSSGVSRSSCG